MGLKVKLKGREKKRKPLLRAFDENEGLDEDTPFDDAEFVREMKPKARSLATIEKEVDLDEIPTFNPDSDDDPFGGRPRFYLVGGRYAIVLQDRHNWQLYHFLKSFNKKQAKWAVGYRARGYYGSLGSAIGGVARKCQSCALTLETRQELKDVMDRLEAMHQELLTEVQSLEMHRSTSGDEKESIAS